MGESKFIVRNEYKRKMAKDGGVKIYRLDDRGYLIESTAFNLCYLQHDGEFTIGLTPFNESSVFFETLDSAILFYGQWKTKVNACLPVTTMQ